MGRGPSAAADPMIGSLIGGRYEVLRKIARGGMGTIYEVRNTRIGRSFALKTLSAEAAEDPEVLIRFRREAEVVAKLRHPNIVEVVDWDALDDGSPFLVMEYLRGEPLATRLRTGGPLPWPALAAIADQVLAALSVAHKAGVVHRDLKPENIFLTIDDEGEMRAKLLDFGISKLRDSKTFATTDSRVLGTPAYMAPEQAEGHHDEIGPATDVWAMGAIVYEMATGKIAFDAPSTPAILYRVCHGDVRPVAELRRDAPAALVALLSRSLTRAVHARPSDVDLFRAQLRAALKKLDGVSWPEPLRTRIETPLAFSAVHAAVPAPDDDDELAAATAGSGGSALAVSPTAARPAGSRLETAGSAQPTLTEPRPPRRSRWPLVAGGAVVFAGAVVAAFLVLRPPPRSPPPAEPPVEPAPEVATAVTTAAPPATDDVVIEPVIETARQPPAAARVPISITSDPIGADVYRMPSETKVGTTPYTDEIDRADGTAVFVLRLPRYRDATVELDQRVGGAIDRRLVKEPAAKKSGRSRKSGGGRRKGEPIDPFDKPGGT